MARPPRIDFPGSIHHVMNRGANHQRVFFADVDRLEFERLLGEIDQLFGVKVIAYCLMNNHYHLIVSCPDGNLSVALQHLGSVYTRHTNDRIGRDGALFRGRFRSILIDSHSYLFFAVRYVDRNSLDLPGVRTARDHYWGSHRMYLGLRRCPAFLDSTCVLNAFGSPESYERFVSGDEPFAKHSAFDLATIRSLVQLSTAEFLDDDETASSTQSIHRTVMHLIAHELGDDVGRAILEALDFASTNARQRSLYRAKARRATDETLRLIVDNIIDTLRCGRAAA
jgi:REP element-mobilizing transposase RayT